MMYPMKPITKKPIAQACKILRYSIKSIMSIAMKGKRRLTGLVGLCALVEEDLGVVGKLLNLLCVVLVLVFPAGLSCR